MGWQNKEQGTSFSKTPKIIIPHLHKSSVEWVFFTLQQNPKKKKFSKVYKIKKRTPSLALASELCGIKKLQL